MGGEYLGRDVIQVLDDLVLNLVGLRTQCNMLPDEIIDEILVRAKRDLLIVTEGLICLEKK